MHRCEIRTTQSMWRCAHSLRLSFFAAVHGGTSTERANMIGKLLRGAVDPRFACWWALAPEIRYDEAVVVMMMLCVFDYDSR